ncbi:MAG: zinc ABC transporter substrate-binding protein [Ilumatobacteraceae bacterium]|nr:zinc ABC transporter substrate-binding protein [Ilumatobacteraceae bacterium]
MAVFQVDNGSHYCYDAGMTKQLGQYPVRTLVVLGLVTTLTACQDSQNTKSEGSTKPVVVATYSILGDVVTDLVGNAADVVVIIANGQDPHEFEPSVKDIEQINKADLVISNGLDLEEHLVDALAQAAAKGVAMFAASEHVTVRAAGPELTDGKDNKDPHLWLDPLTLAEMIPDLSAELGKVLGVDLASRATELTSKMSAINEQAMTIMSPVSNCVLVTGHDSLGYFAARYGCNIVGAVIPSLSSLAETSAGELADLKKLATSAKVRAIFTELGTPRAVVDQIAKEVGVKSVELQTHVLPIDGHYADLITSLAASIADALK